MVVLIDSDHLPYIFNGFQILSILAPKVNVLRTDGAMTIIQWKI